MKNLSIILFCFLTATTAPAQIEVDSIGIDTSGQVLLKWTSRDTLQDGSIRTLSNVGTRTALKEEYKNIVLELRRAQDQLKAELGRIKNREKAILKEFKISLPANRNR